MLMAPTKNQVTINKRILKRLAKRLAEIDLMTSSSIDAKELKARIEATIKRADAQHSQFESLRAGVRDRMESVAAQQERLRHRLYHPSTTADTGLDDLASLLNSGSDREAILKKAEEIVAGGVALKPRQQTFGLVADGLNLAQQIWALGHQLLLGSLVAEFQALQFLSANLDDVWLPEPARPILKASQVGLEAVAGIVVTAATFPAAGLASIAAGCKAALSISALCRSLETYLLTKGSDRRLVLKTLEVAEVLLNSLDNALATLRGGSKTLEKYAPGLEILVNRITSMSDAEAAM
jgi:hypothetical protein